MRSSLKAYIAIAASVLLSVLVAGPVSGQHLISSRAGFVNRTEGNVYIQRADSPDAEKGRASMGTQMRDGDKLITEGVGLAEILLNPGSYLRMDEDTQITALRTGLSQIRFELNAGSVIIEIGEVDKKMPIEIVTPNGTLFIRKDGLHRIDINGPVTQVAVRQGELILGNRDEALRNKGFKIKRGKVAGLTSDSGTPLLAKLDKDKIDEFDVWSFNRAQALVAANYSTLRRSGRYDSLAYGWIFNPFYSCYTFIPRRGLFYSPYGFGFFRSYYDCYACYYSPYGYYGGGYGGRSGNNNSGAGSTTAGNVPSRVIAGNDREPVRREVDSRRIISNPGYESSSDPFGGARSRSISTTSSSPSTSTLPAPSPTRSSSSSSESAPMPSRRP